MTAAFTEGSERIPRRGRYTPRQARVTLTPLKMALLHVVADYGLVTTAQLAHLVCPSEKSARRNARELFDGGLLHIAAVPRAVLAEPGAPNDVRLLYGSAPNIYHLSRKGMQALVTAGQLEAPVPIFRFGPRNWSYLAHEIAIRDVRVWLERTAQQTAEQRLQTWRHGGEAVIDLERSRLPNRVVPDAWFVYRLGEKALVGLVEVNRGTERGGKRWKEKLEAYGALFQSNRLKAQTGYSHARVLVFTPTAQRRDNLAALIHKHAAALAGRFWLTQQTSVAHPGFTNPVWVQAGATMPGPFLPLISSETMPRGDML